MRSLVFIFSVLPYFVFSQNISQPDAAQIKLKLKKLNVLSSVMYVAAHPDDENTRIITYLANDRLSATAYLSMTRGDGGQNLIGSEMRDQLGLIRTHELLEARRIDGGEQFFTRANDFGYSKSADETFRVWGKDEILSDVVRILRRYQPDVIITRFPPDERAGHGHHTASAVLAQDAFDAAANPTVYPEQVKQFGVWNVKRLYTNTGRWWNTTINEGTPGIITLHVGGYSPLLGKSFTEIAAISRSQHKSQGFGSAGSRGDQLEFLEFIKGERASKDIFEGINTSWSRVKGGDKIQPLVTKAILEFKEDEPHTLVPSLLVIRSEILKLENNIWKERKLKEVETLIQDCLSLFLEVTADNYHVAPGEKVTARFELVNRSGMEVNINKIKADDLALDTVVSLSLKNNVAVQFKTIKTIDNAKKYSAPYWLTKPHSIGLFTVDDSQLIGKPENDPAVNINFSVSIGGVSFIINRSLIYKWTDPAKGELERPFEIIPAVVVNVNKPVFIFGNNGSQIVTVSVKTESENVVKGDLKLELPAGWTSEPASAPFELTKRGNEFTKSFVVTSTLKEETGTLKAVAHVEGKGMFDQSLSMIRYDHIPAQTLMPKAEAKVVRLDLRKEGRMIGYIKGAGDDTPASLRHIGYEVWEMKDEEVNADNLTRIDAVVIGIRALNTNEGLRFIMPTLFEYVKNGGTLVMQYNTKGNMNVEAFSPYPLTISNERVTEEDAVVRILKPDHAVMNTPNKITAKDFDGWIQERGLYFPNVWDANFEAILSMNDTGETAKDGSLLIAKYGEGYYVYTGLSFFRELPEGVAGAYKLFTNIVSLRAPKSLPVTDKKRKRSK